MRSTLSPAFTGSKMRAMYLLMTESAEQFINHFLEKPTTGTIEVEMKETLRRFTNDVIATCAFGIKCDSLKDKNNEFYLMGKDVASLDGLKGLKFFAHNLSPWIVKLFKIKIVSDEVSSFFRDIIKSTMNVRENKGIIRPDMIHLLMEAKKGRLKYEESQNDDTGFATVEESYIGKTDTKIINGKIYSKMS